MQIFKTKFKMVYFQFQMLSVFWVWLTSWFENSVITNLVHLMVPLKLPNLHIPFFITSYIIRAAHLTFWNLTARKTEQQVQDSSSFFWDFNLLTHSPACVMVHRLLQLCNYYLSLYFDGSELLQSCFPNIFYALMLY